MKQIKGYLVAIGGAEDKGDGKASHREHNDIDFYSKGILKDIQELLMDSSIEVITAAAAAPDQTYTGYEKAFRKLGVTPHHLRITNRQEADDKKVLQRVERCGGVMITGGDQARLSSILGGTQLKNILEERYHAEPFVIAGTSAGAACMSSTMLAGGSSDKGNIKGEIDLSLGLGFIDSVIIDTHFDTRARFARLAEAIAIQPGIIGVGLGEDTGVVIEKGSYFRSIGSDSVTIIDGSRICYNNVAEVEEGQPISIARMEVYLMARYDGFDFSTRTFIPATSKERLKG